MGTKNPGDIAIRIRLTGGKAVISEVGRTAEGIKKAGAEAELGAFGFKQFSHGIDQTVKKSHGWMQTAKGFVASWAGISGAMEIKSFLQDTTKEALTNQAAMRSFSLSLQNSTHATNSQVEASGKWVESMATGYGFMKTDLLRGYQQLAQTTHSTTKAQLLLRLAMDASAQTGKPLTTVTMALVRAQNGNVAALGRLGIATKDVHGKTESFGQLLVNMQKTFKGGAATAAASFQGQMAKLSEQFNELKIRIGNWLLPALGKLTHWFMAVAVPAVQRAISQFTRYRGTMGDIHHAINGVIMVVKAIVGWFAKHTTTTKVLVTTLVGLYVTIHLLAKASRAYEKAETAVNFVKRVANIISKAKKAATLGESAATGVLTASTNEARVAQLLMNAAWLANPITWVIVGLVALAATFVLLWQHSDKFRKKVTDAFHDFLLGAQAIWNWLRVMAPRIGHALAAPFTAAFHTISAVWGKITGLFSRAKMAIGKVTVGMFDGIKSAFVAVVDFIIGAWNNSYGKIINGAAGLASHIPGLGFLGHVNATIPTIGSSVAAGHTASIPQPHAAAQRVSQATHLSFSKAVTTSIFNPANATPTHVTAEVDGETLFHVMLNHTQKAGALA